MNLLEKAKNIRKRVFDLSKQEGFAHIGSCLSCVEIMTALFFKVMQPGDRFIMSKGHASAVLYATLIEKGIMKEKAVKYLSEHPDKNEKYGIYCSTGSLGHGLPIGCGMAVAGKKTFVLMSDGELDEGSTWEAIRFAGERRLVNLIAIIDANRWQAYRATNVERIKDKLFGFRWGVKLVNNAHKLDNLELALRSQGLGVPLFIIAHTVKGKGWRGYEGKLESHYAKL